MFVNVKCLHVSPIFHINRNAQTTDYLKVCLKIVSPWSQNTYSVTHNKEFDLPLPQVLPLFTLDIKVRPSLEDERIARGARPQAPMATQKSLFPERGKGLPCMTLSPPCTYHQKQVGLIKPTSNRSGVS